MILEDLKSTIFWNICWNVIARQVLQRLVTLNLKSTAVNLIKRKKNYWIVYGWGHLTIKMACILSLSYCKEITLNWQWLINQKTFQCWNCNFCNLIYLVGYYICLTSISTLNKHRHHVFPFPSHYTTWYQLLRPVRVMRQLAQHEVKIYIGLLRLTSVSDVQAKAKHWRFSLFFTPASVQPAKKWKGRFWNIWFLLLRFFFMR